MEKVQTWAGFGHHGWDRSRRWEFQVSGLYSWEAAVESQKLWIFLFEGFTDLRGKDEVVLSGQGIDWVLRKTIAKSLQLEQEDWGHQLAV